MRTQYDAEDVSRAIGALADKVAATFSPAKPLGIIGIRTRGEVLAQRLTSLLKSRGFSTIERGTLDITLYRDDLSEIGPKPLVRPTAVDFDLSGMPILLVDDAFTGRSIRAALSALSDFGRPGMIRLLVLADRGGRELPIQADFVGLALKDVPRDHRVNVRLKEADTIDEIVVEQERPRAAMTDQRTNPIADPKPRWQRKHLLSIEELTPDEIRLILDQADAFKEVSTRSIKKVPALRGRVVVNAFFEDSTRTRTSFALAAQRLSADVIDFSEKTSSTSKGETLIDTARNIEAMGIDVIVVRHNAAGSAEYLSRNVKCSVVNAGDGAHEHPTQGLLDVYTMRERFGRIEGLKVAIVGDISNSRVARSNLWALTKLGAKVILVGPPTLLPKAFEQLGAKVVHDFDSIIGEVDVINMLRVQFERVKSSQFPSVREFTRLFGLTSDRFLRCKKDVFVMHPGPMNRGIEIQSHIADGPQSGILTQVTNGLAVRMAVLYLVTSAG